MRRISSSLDEIQDHYEVVVIGSGYGGGIAASRMARAGRKVCLLERGREIIPGEYPDTELEATEEMQITFPGGHVGKHTGMFDFHVNPQQNALVGCGLGGTSLINANVALEAEPEVFENPRWPQSVREHKDTLLQEGYARAREMLKPNPYPDDGPALPKMEANFKSGRFMKQNVYKTPINVTFQTPEGGVNHVGVEQEACTNCGDCVSGCNYKAKNTTLMNYLPDAWNHGADIFTEASVQYLEKRDDGWLVHYQPVNDDRGAFDAPPLFVKADIVILSAGTLGSTGIMLRSQAKGLSLSGQLGENFSGNGDILGFGYNNDETINGIGFGNHPVGEIPPVGPCITSIIDMRTGDAWSKRMIIEEGSIPGALGKLIPAAISGASALTGKDTDSGFFDAVKEKARELESLLRGPYHGAVNNMQTYLIMSHDNGKGRLVLDDKDAVRIDWPDVGEQPNFIIGNDNLFQATKALGGTYVPNPIWTDAFKHSLVTVHPLGGCVMGEDATQGVVNHKGQVFDGQSGTAVHEGLYITDGSVIPTSLAINPLLTISAVSERAMSLLAQDHGWHIDYSLPSKPREQAVTSDKLGIQFTETMKGFFSTSANTDLGTDLPAYEQAYDQGRTDNSPIEFTLTITSHDLDATINNPAHAAAILGTVEAPTLSSTPLMASDGTFNLFEVYPEQVNTRHMNYNMKLTSEEGRTYFFRGFKVVKDDGVLNIWHDTSTLYITVFEGHDDSGPVVGSGVMHIHPTDFAKQMTTMKVLNATSTAQRLEALERFGKYFAGVLWGTYGGILSGDKYFNPDAPPRKKRPLRVGAPEVHFFKTDDGVELRLIRYQGGQKGPVMLVHGAGVASSIFSTDTIPTNLLEYLYAHNYDVWLLDFRVSIELEASKQQSNGDQIAQYDFPAAITQIQTLTGAKDVQCVVHCYGATTFFMSLLAGLQGVRSVVCSQIATEIVVPTATAVKTGLHVPGFLDKLGIKSLTAYTDSESGWFSKLYDKALDVYALAEAQGHCNNPVCHRITFMYASLYRHATLNDTLHNNLHELFGESNMETFEHLALLCREGKLLNFEGQDVYMPHLDRLQLPICFISGEENECYLPESTERTYDTLQERFDAELYSRYVIPGYGHIDCMFGKDAVDDVYPHILDHLDKTAEA